MATLVETWKTLYVVTLPNLARSKSSVQSKWPVNADHCFARIILDSVIGRGETFDPPSCSVNANDTCIPAPWSDKLKAPAIKNMGEIDMKQCIALAEAIADGRVNLVDLNERSLEVRSKASKSDDSSIKRKNSQKNDMTTSSSQLPKSHGKPKARKIDQKDIRAAFRSSRNPSNSPRLPAPIHPEVQDLVESSGLTPFRKRVLLALCEIPEGEVSTYLALSNFLDSAPRAVGNALRNNPFAPRVPCHRIVAADRTIGGFGGSWGVHGEHFNKKVALLKKEGVKVSQDGKIGNAIWEGFV